MNIENNRKRANRVLKIAREMARRADKANGTWTESNSIESIQLYLVDEAYSEPGYSADVGVAVGNWNPSLARRVGDVLEKLGLELEWSDEWSDCSHCGKLVRTSGDSYRWQPSFVVGDGELSCHECVEQEPAEHLEALEGRTDACNTIDTIDPADYGYVRVSDHETGWHPGQTDDPVKVAGALEDLDISRYLFNLDANGQFDSKWSCWVHESQAGLLKQEEDNAQD